jgi:hypothetical protein
MAELRAAVIEPRICAKTPAYLRKRPDLAAWPTGGRPARAWQRPGRCGLIGDAQPIYAGFRVTLIGTVTRRTFPPLSWWPAGPSSQVIQKSPGTTLADRHICEP